MKNIERIAQVIDSKNISIRAFEISIGASNGAFGRAIKNNTDVSSEWLSIIIEKYPDLDAEWLLTGKGEMLKQSEDVIHKKTNKIAPAVKIHNNDGVNNAPVPLYELPIGQSLSTMFSTNPIPVDNIYIPGLPKCDGAIAMRGDDMAPVINGGDIVLYKQVKKPKTENSILYGQIYLLSFEAENEEHIVIKYIYQADSDNITLVSYNKKKPDKTIPLTSIKALALVKASVRFETMA